MRDRTHGPRRLNRRMCRLRQQGCRGCHRPARRRARRCVVRRARALAIPAAALAFDPALEAKNFAKTAERMQYVTLTPEFQLRLQQANLDNVAEVAQIVASDPERNFTGNVCANGGNECAGDVRFYDWEDDGLRDPQAGAVHRAQRRDALRPRLGDARQARPSARRS